MGVTAGNNTKGEILGHRHWSQSDCEV